MSEPDEDIAREADRVAVDHHLRSRCVQSLVSRPDSRSGPQETACIPRVLVQYWDDPDGTPADVQMCIDSWASVTLQGFQRLLYDDISARDFIALRFDRRHIVAFDRCDHPAMRADYFRLCFISLNGGLYIDADDEYVGSDLSALLDTSKLLIQPLCYQISTDSMVDPMAVVSSSDDDLIFYVNNNPIAAPSGHPVISAALEQATRRLTERNGEDRDIQSLTGPGNLTEALVRHSIELDSTRIEADFSLLRRWDEYSVSKWPLDYRSDERNWRHWVRGERAT